MVGYWSRGSGEIWLGDRLHQLQLFAAGRDERTNSACRDFCDPRVASQSALKDFRGILCFGVCLFLSLCSCTGDFSPSVHSAREVAARNDLSYPWVVQDGTESVCGVSAGEC